MDGAAARLADGLALWRGEVLADVDASWAVPMRTRLGELRLAAQEERLDAELARGRHAEAAAELTELVELHPLRERLWRLCVLALSGAGRPAEALRGYERYRRHLADELGLEPSPAMRQLERAVLERDRSVTTPTTAPPAAAAGTDGPSSAAAAEAGATSATTVEATSASDAVAADIGAVTSDGPRPTDNLPVALTSFVGRRELLGALLDTLPAARLLTLTGPGGAGKTRLAVELAQAALGSHPGGAWFVDLAPVGEAAFVARAVADALGIGEQPGRDLLDVLAAALAHRPSTLILLDNCEHLLDPAALLADRLLRQCPTLRLLATSRTPLGVGGEWVRSVPPLGVTAAGGPPHLDRQSEAVQLLLERARQVLADIGSPAVASDDEVSTAAAICRRLDGLPLAIELAAGQLRVLSLVELAQRLEDPFGLLRRTRPFPDRHATLLATVEWSYDRLSEPARDLFAACSVFAGPFGIDAALAVADGASSAAAVLGVLTELVDASMLVREPPVAGETRFRLLETLRVFARRQLEASGRLERVRQAAAGFYLAYGRAAGPGLSGPEEATWLSRLRVEGPNLRSVLAWARYHDPELGVGLGLALLDYWLTPSAWLEGKAHFCALAETCSPETPAVRAWALSGAAYLLADGGESRRAVTWATEALQLFADLGETRGEAFARLALGSALRGRAWLDRATLTLGASLAAWRQKREHVLEARCLSLLGTIDSLRGDYAAAQARFEASLALWTELGSASGRAMQWWSMAALAHYRGDDPAALASCRRAIDLYTAVDDLLSVAHVEMVMGDVARARGELRRAREIYERVMGEFQRVGDRRCTASSQKNLAVVAFQLGDRATARSHYLDALIARHDLGDDGGVAECLEGLSDVSSAEGGPTRAASLLAAAFSVRQRTGVRSPADERAGVAERLAAIRSRLGPDAFARAWARGWVLDATGAVELGLRPP